MAFTQPAYSLPIVLDGTETIVVAITGTDTGFTATLTAGTYYNHADAFIDQVATDLQTADVAANGAGSTWTAQAVATGLTFRIELTRGGGAAGDQVDTMTVTADNLRRALGWSALAITPATGEVVNAPGDNTVVTTMYQRGYVWLPRVILTRDHRPGQALIASARTPAGKASVDRYGGFRRFHHVIGFVHGASVYVDKAADSGFSGNISGMTAGDNILPLETWWELAGTGAGGTPPTIKYLPDASVTGTTVDMMITDSEWLGDMDNVAKEINESPLLYEVTIDGQEDV